MVNEEWDVTDVAPASVEVDYARPLGLPIMFSEVPLGTSVTDQYDALGIVVGGDSPFTVNDGANPTSPVLSGTPTFIGDITMEFVEPGSTTPNTVDMVAFDVGYINDDGGVVVTTHDLDGSTIATTTYGCCGIVRAALDQPGIHRVMVDVQDFEGNGVAIDNVSFG